MVQLKLYQQILIINAIGFSKAIGVVGERPASSRHQPVLNARNQFNKGTAGIPTATTCDQINCGPSHICQVVPKGFCLPLLPCPGVATCIPVATPRIGTSNAARQYTTTAPRADSRVDRGEYKGIVKGLTTSKLPQVDKGPLVFLTQKDIEQRLKES